MPQNKDQRIVSFMATIIAKIKGEHDAVVSGVVAEGEQGAEDVCLADFSEALITDLEWKVFEDLCCTYFIERGVRAEVTHAHLDRIADIYLYKDGSLTPSTMIQCRTRDAGKVDIQMIQTLLGGMQTSHISRGILMVSGSIPSKVRRFSRDKPITLVSGHNLYKLVQDLSLPSQQKLMTIVFQGGYNIPTCSACGSKMERKMHHHGGDKGEYYWCCLGAPLCLHTMKVH